VDTAQLKRPFDIYHKNIGKHFPKTPPSRMLEVLCRCDEAPLSTTELRQMLNVNRSSVHKLLKTLKRKEVNLVQVAEVQQHDGKVPDCDRVKLSRRGRKVLRDLAAAIGVVLPVARQTKDNTSKARSETPSVVVGRSYREDQIPLPGL